MDKFTKRLIDLIMEAEYIPFDDEENVDFAARMLAESYADELKKIALLG